MPTWDKKLIRYRIILNQFPIESPENTGVGIVSTLLRVEDSLAKIWVDAHGNPIGDPIAGVILATLVGLNGSLILASCLSDGRNDLVSLSRRLDLSVAMLKITLDASISFPDIVSQSMN